MKFQTMYNQREHHHIGEVFRKPSMSVPDDALTIAQIVHNHVRQIPSLTTEKQKIFLGEDQVIDFSMDNIDRLDLLDSVKSEINATRTNFLQQQEEKQKNKKQAPPKPSEKEGDAAGGERSTEQPQAQRSEASGAK